MPFALYGLATTHGPAAFLCLIGLLLPNGNAIGFQAGDSS